MTQFSHENGPQNNISGVVVRPTQGEGSFFMADSAITAAAIEKGLDPENLTDAQKRDIVLEAHAGLTEFVIDMLISGNAPSDEQSWVPSSQRNPADDVWDGA